MKRSLNKKFALIFLALLAALFVALIVAAQIAANVFTQDYIDDDVMSSHATMSSEITDTLNEVNYGYTRMTQCDTFPSVLSGEYSDETKEAFLKMINDASLSDDYVNVVLCYDDIVFALKEDTDMPSRSFAAQITAGGDILRFGDIDGTGRCLLIGRRVVSSLYGVNGYMVFYVSAEAFNGICSATDEKIGKTMLVTENYDVIASSDGQNVGKTIFESDKYRLENGSVERKKIDGQNSIVAVTEVKNQYNLGWYLISVLNGDVLQKDFVIMSWVLAALAVVSFLLAVIFAIRVAKNTAAPINGLSRKLSKVDFTTRQGLFDIGSEGDELYELELNYEEMIQRLFKLMDENKENMETQRKLEIDALQMQINPHFLYNTLDAIAWMAKIKKQPEIEKLVINLAKFFRLSLHKGDKYIRIKEETELIEHFLEIEKIRFPNTINYVCDIPAGVGEYKTLKLILQPIVENCIKHGFSGRSGVGTITISAKEDGEDIVIDVSDDGNGFVIQDDFLTKKSDKPNGYGLYNVNERIKLEYGADYGLSVRSTVGEGTTVTVRIKKNV